MCRKTHVISRWLLFINNGDQMAVEGIFKVLGKQTNCQAIILHSGKLLFQKWKQNQYISIQIKNRNNFLLADPPHKKSYKKCLRLKDMAMTCIYRTTWRILKKYLLISYLIKNLYLEYKKCFKTQKSNNLIAISNKEKQTTDTCYNLYTSQKSYTRWKNPHTKDNI